MHTVTDELLSTRHHKDLVVCRSFLGVCSVKLVLPEKRMGKMSNPNREKDELSLFCLTLPLLWFFPLKKTPDWLSGKCMKILVLEVMLSVLMEVEL